ncbi:tRNA (adenosine(37)-N6)-threonylcarbamoyltransferase complex dimerization subunit type 1 TsaB [Patescibacteria group bacterium]
MIILGLNTATNISQIALIKNGEILAEDSWKSEQNEAETLLPNIKKLLEKAKIQWSDVDKIAVIKGPGPFTALRISIAVANTLAYGLNLPIWGIPVQDYWEYRTNGPFVLQAGLNRIFYNEKLIDFDDLDVKGEISGHLKPIQIEKLEQKGVKFKNEEELQTLGEFLTQADYKDEKLIKPEYFAPPTITKSHKNYK